ncbi:hypothetical protein TWF281_011520 [Arthrobotrys megalospora]
MPDETTYHPRDAIASTTNAVLLNGAAGILVSGVQNTLAKENRGLFGLVTKTGGTIAMFAAVGGTYAFIKDASANLRETNDPWNAALGGFFGGALIGIRTGRIPYVLGFGAGLATLLASFDAGGNHWRGYKWREGYVDDVARREAIRSTRRRPYEETIEEIGEGRGIYGPGYAERRAARLKEKYGIEVPTEHEKPYAY